MNQKRIAIVLMAMIVSACATSSHRVAGPEDPFAMPIEAFMEEMSTLRADLVMGEPRQIDNDDLQRFDEIESQIASIVGSATELDEIPLYQRNRLYELRTKLVNLVVGDRSTELVCFRRQATGTRLKGQTQCYTLAELEKERFNGQRLMQWIENHPHGQHPDAHDPGSSPTIYRN